MSPAEITGLAISGLGCLGFALMSFSMTLRGHGSAAIAAAIWSLVMLALVAFWLDKTFVP